VVVSVDPLDEDMLVQILTDPKNAVVKQYQKLFALDDVELVFEPEALRAAAQRAMELKMGARGLRTIIEEALLNVMYEIPSLDNVRSCIIKRATIEEQVEPELIMWPEAAEDWPLEETA
jgi:ATP-dependent Clp protease ATP-binding subunit ClpX